MKKTFYFIVALVAMIAMSACNPENEPQGPIDPNSIYLMGYNKDNGIPTNNLTAGSPISVRAAVMLPGADVAAKARQIIGVRFYVDGCDGGNAFISADLNNIEVTKSFTFEKGGWQYVIFDQPYEVTADHDYYLGYEMVGTTLGTEKVSGKGKKNFLDQGEGFETFTELGFGSYTNCIQAICVGGDYSAEKQNGIIIDDLDVKPNMRAGDVVPFSVAIRNAGVKTTGTINVAATVGSETLNATVSGLRNGETKLVNFTIQGVGIDIDKVTVEATEDVAGKATASKAINVYAADAPFRTCIFIEEFTSQLCPNCPRAITAIRDAIAQMSDPSKAAWVAHHSGYYNDDFTIQGDLDVASSFGVNYAPAAMFDRMPVPGETDIAFCPGTSFPFSFDDLAEIPANASIDMDVTYADSLLTVTISGKSYKQVAYATVLLCQNGLVRTQSNGGNDFVHGEVVRAYLTAARGDQLTIAADGTYTATYTYTMPAEITGVEGVSIPTDADNMFVVAAIHGKTADKAPVYNAARANLK